VGAEAQGRGDTNAARRRYLEALRHDPNNRGAQLNLAVAELTLTPQHQGRHDHALGHLGSLQTQLEQLGARGKDVLWYRVRYTQTVAHLDPQYGDYAKACDAAVDLCEALLNQAPLKVKHNMPHRDFIKHVEPMALAVLASALKEAGHPPQTCEESDAVDREELKAALKAAANDGTTPSRFGGAVTHATIAAYVAQASANPDAQYNLACYFALCNSGPR